MLTFEASSAVAVAQELTDRLPENTPTTARKLFKALVWLGVETTRRRGHAPTTTEAIFHVPLELLADAVGVSRVTAWRHLPALRSLGLVDYRPHKGTCRGETRNTGCVWRVRLSPLKGSKARLGFDDLKHRWRDLERDVRAGRTSYKALKHTLDLQDPSLKIESLLAWTLPPVTHQNPGTPVCFTTARGDLESLLDVHHASREDRGQAVDLAAQALAQALRDAQGVNWFRKLLWQLLRRYDATGEDHSYQVYLAAVRARTDALEGFARKPGAIFTSRIKGAPWWDEVMRSPPTRVGLPPRAVMCEVVR